MKSKNRLRTHLDGYVREQQTLVRQLSQMGFIWPGSITQRRLTCGNRACACRTSPSARHGPYTYWTTKKDGKTVGKLLKGEEAELLQEWVDNRKRLDALLRKLHQLSRRAFKTALRVKKLQRRQPRENPRLNP